MDPVRISGHIVDVLHRTVFPGTVVVEDGHIRAITRESEGDHDRFILPGFVDAHVHIESSMLVPSEFMRIAAVHGTVATVSDPHEIANVMGLSGIHFMRANAAQTPGTVALGAPSCVPATAFETSGASLSAEDIRFLFAHAGLTYLSEVMNVPGVLGGDPEIMAKLRIAQELGVPIDGHAPGLRGADARRYAGAGITTDHECCALEEALDKIAAGMKILIREGSAAKNFDALHPLLSSHPDRCMLCSDDRHPDDLLQGHIHTLVQRAVALGHDVMDVLQAACVQPVRHYRLPVGLLQPGDPADFIVVRDLRDFEVQQTYCKGRLVAEDGRALLPSVEVEPINCFETPERRIGDFRLPGRGGEMVRAIVAVDGQLVTGEAHVRALVERGAIVSDVSRDLLKLAVINRYADRPPAVALVQNFGLRRGALASSVAHDSHNVVAVGATDEDLCAAVNTVIRARGGIAVADGGAVDVLPLPIAGLMSRKDGRSVGAHYARLDAHAKRLGSTLTAPFMTLAFMALLVIPDLKLSDRGLFSGKEFRFVPLLVE